METAQCQGAVTVPIGRGLPLGVETAQCQGAMTVLIGRGLPPGVLTCYHCIFKCLSYTFCGKFLSLWVSLDLFFGLQD